MAYVTIRIKATGQVTEMVPDVARALILGGSAEEVNQQSRTESMVMAGAERAVTPEEVNQQSRTESMVMAGAERAVTPAQDGPSKKHFGRKR